ncbi:hypothetical protein WKI68_03500 [Streptomyces sp. MS1.HAVA.3]|uniref:Uncharacterized protein n=1 Tax=Streptomyces caledonius TaxID=3134107 RepID=A0ABU8TYR6_9ACTN
MVRRPLEEAAAHARALGLSVAPVERSPYDTALDETDRQPTADGAFWTGLHRLVAERGGVLLEEQYVAHARRWHRLTAAAQVTLVRAGLTPRARLAVWPDLTDDIGAVRDAVLRGERRELLVQQDADGSFRPVRVAEPWMGRPDLAIAPIQAGPGRRATLVPLDPAERRPLLAGVLPDADGVVRARRRTNRTPADERRTLLGSLRVGTSSPAPSRAAWTTSECTSTWTTSGGAPSASCASPRCPGSTSSPWTTSPRSGGGSAPKCSTSTGGGNG